MFAAPPPVPFGAVPRPAFGRDAQHLPPHATPHKLRAEARYRRAARLAADLLPDLPEPGEVVHALMLGSFDLCQVIAATAARLPGLCHLRVATLCFSKRNVAELCGLLDARPGLALTVLVSSFFREHNKELFEHCAEHLGAYPAARLGAARSHCKVTLFDLGGGDALVFEGSANLRTNKNREQLAVFRDRGLHDWHAGWIDGLVGADGAKKEA